MSPEEKVRRATHAEQLLRDELLNEAFASIEQAYMTAWRNSKVGEVEAREFAYNMVSAITLLKRQLIGFVQEGQIAQADIEYANSLQEDTDY